jgi:cell division protein FtsQ
LNTGKTIQKILFVSMWLLIASGMIVLLAAAMSKQKNEECKDYKIVIKSKSSNLFIDEKDAEQLLILALNGRIRNQPLASFNLSKLEHLLEGNSWIMNAQVYFDMKNVLHVDIQEREPIARIFTTAGSSYYIDSAEYKLPLSDKKSARVPVFTDFPENGAMVSKDSLLLSYVKSMAMFINSDSFWTSQVSQIDVTPEGNFEMVPLIGNHIVKLGDGDDIEKKFSRLFLFYRQVLSKTGFDKYRRIDVRFAGQVVATNEIGDTGIDSLQYRKNIEKLIMEAQAAEDDTTLIAKPMVTKQTVTNDSIPIDANTHELTSSENKTPPIPNLMKAALSRQKEKLVRQAKVPKALMPKKQEQ